MSGLSLFKGRVEDLVKGALTFGKRNAPSLMTGGGILLGWTAVYIFWKQSKKAEKVIEEREIEIDADLPKKEKIAVYLQYCWMALALGVGSSGLVVWAHKIDLSRIAEMYMLAQFWENKNDEKRETIDALKNELGPKKAKKVEDELLEKEYPKEVIMEELGYIPGDGRTLFIDRTMRHFKFRSDIQKVRDGIYKFNRIMDAKRDALVRKEKNGAFYVNDTPFKEENYDYIWIEESVDTFLECIGEGDNCDSGIGELLKIRYSGGGCCIDPDDIMTYREFEDPTTGIPQVCYLDYERLLTGSDSLLNRN